MLDKAIRLAQNRAYETAEIYSMELLQALQSELVLRAWKAWRSYRSSVADASGFDRDKLWANWLNDHLNSGVRDVLRDHTAERSDARRAFLAAYKVVPLHEPRGRVTGDDVKADYALDEEDPRIPADVTGHVAAKLLLDRACKIWNEKERFIIYSVHIHGMTLKEVSEALNMTSEGVRKAMQRAFTKVTICIADPFDGED